MHTFLFLGSLVLCVAYVQGFFKTMPSWRASVSRKRASTALLSGRRRKDSRKIIGKDNLGDPIYEGEERTSGGGINILGARVQLDPVTASGIVFLVLIAQFFGVGLFQND